MGKVEFRHIATREIDPNEGQIEGLPANPRSWTEKEMALLKASLSETGELFEYRGLLVVPHRGRYVALGGNMKLAAVKDMYETVPCCVFPEDMSKVKMQEVVIKDNASYGKWDFDALNREWRDLPIETWGVDEMLLDMTKETKEKDENEMKSLTVSMPSETYYRVVDRLRKFDDDFSVALKKALKL